MSPLMSLIFAPASLDAFSTALRPSRVEQAEPMGETGGKRIPRPSERGSNLDIKA
jgi:hypothetical protein